MLVMSEYVSRMLRKRSAQDPTLSDDEAELGRIAREAMRDPDSFVTDDEDRAFLALARATSVARREIEDAEDAEAYGESAPAASDLTRTRHELQRCLEIDPHCYDARLLLTLADAKNDDDVLARLLALEDEARAWCRQRSDELDGFVLDPWDALFMRPYLRIEGRIVDLLTTSARYRAALERCRRLLADSPADGQGIRHTAALILARLEDEKGLDDLDARFGRTGSAWMHVARAILLYKLGRMDAARRAVTGLATLCPGAAYYLANPTYVQPYLPDRPPFTPGTAQESLLATYEADFLVMDTPDFVTWALSVESFTHAASEYGRLHGDDL